MLHRISYTDYRTPKIKHGINTWLAAILDKVIDCSLFSFCSPFMALAQVLSDLRNN
jgi:hypothetical protein